MLVLGIQYMKAPNTDLRKWKLIIFIINETEVKSTIDLMFFFQNNIIIFFPCIHASIHCDIRLTMTIMAIT